jgi:uncharacterized protein YndB with AHSA1/START domain
MATANVQQESASVAAAAPARRKISLVKKVLLGLAVVVVGFVVVVTVQPSDFRVSRSATIAAPPAAVFAQVNDFHNWEAWSPFVKLDPAATITYEGAPEGTGAVYRWSGNSEAGEGSSTITESRPGELVRIKLEFVRPFAGTNDVQFTFEPAHQGTSVTWSMSGKKNFIAKAMGLFMDCEEMCGGMFDEGLAKLKSVVESAQGASAPAAGETFLVSLEAEEQDAPPHAQPQKEHKWLDKLVGTWTYEAECIMGPGQPPVKCTGTDSVRSLGGLWVLCEGEGEMPGGGKAKTLMTLGYDPAKKTYLGTFVASMMTHLWIYDRGSLDDSGKVLTLETIGPSFAGDGKMVKYRDVIEFKSDDHRVLLSLMQGDDGKWQTFMTSHYRRKK